MLDNPDDPRSCVCFLLSRAAQSAQRQLRILLEPYSITPAQYLIIECLWVKDGLAPKTIVDLLKFDSAALTGLVDRLERGEWLRREPDPDDRRALRLRLTEKAIKMKKELRRIRFRANEEILKDYTPKQREILKHTLIDLISKDEPIEAIE